MQARLLRTLASELGYPTQRLTFTLTLLNLLQHNPCILRMNVQVIVQLLAEKVVKELLDTSPIGLHIL